MHHDLTGQKFGRLIVVERAGSLKYGRMVPAWRCECDCGRREVLAQPQLLSKGWRECSLCRRPDCIACGKKVPASRPRSATCSETCARSKRQAEWRADYRRRSADPDFNRRRHQRLLERMQADTELAERVRDIRRAAGARWRTNQANRETIRKYMASHYATNRTEIQARRRARLNSMTPAQLAHWRERMRAYQRAYANRYRDQLRADPDRHRAYLDMMREYRRRTTAEKPPSPTPAAP